MAVILEVKSGAFAGQTIALATGQSVVIGRAAGKAEFALPHDTFMSGAHFAVECGAQGCRVVDKKSSNGTFLNGARVQDAMLANGDEIRGGQTVFSVKMVADDKLATLAQSPSAIQTPESSKPSAAAIPPRPSPPAPSAPAAPPVAAPRVSPPAMRTVDEGREAGNVGAAPGLVPPVAPVLPARSGRDSLSASGYGTPAASATPPAIAPKPVAPAIPAAAGKLKVPVLSVMGWSFFSTPEKWQVQDGFGIQQTVKDEFPSSVVATEEMLGGMSLQQFVEAQISMLRQYLREPKIEPAMPPRVAGADESVAVDVRHATREGKEIVYRRIYARSGASVGVLTVTTLAADLPQVLETLQPLLESAAFQSTAGK